MRKLLKKVIVERKADRAFKDIARRKTRAAERKAYLEEALKVAKEKGKIKAKGKLPQKGNFFRASSYVVKTVLPPKRKGRKAIPIRTTKRKAIGLKPLSISDFI